MNRRIKSLFAPLLFAFLCLTGATPDVSAQVGRRAAPTGDRAMLLNVTATRTSDAVTVETNASSKTGVPVSAPVTAADVTLYDDGIEQRIQSFSIDASPARIVLLVDNSLTLRTDVAKLADAARQFAYEIYEGDQLLTIAYDETPEIVADWTDSAQVIESSIKNFRKKGEPHLFDAFDAVINEALRPLTGAAHKRVVVIIGDGLDRGSKRKYTDLLNELQRLDITVYALQLPDRTGGALRRDSPKPTQVVTKLAEATGGRVFSFAEAEAAAKTICDELKKNRYILAYTPTSPSIIDAHRLLVVGNTDAIQVRHKIMQPAK